MELTEPKNLENPNTGKTNFTGIMNKATLSAPQMREREGIERERERKILIQVFYVVA